MRDDFDLPVLVSDFQFYSFVRKDKLEKGFEFFRHCRIHLYGASENNRDFDFRCFLFCDSVFCQKI